MMKCELAMMGLAMISIWPNALFAKDVKKDVYTSSYSSAASSYAPHYGADGWLYPLMDHLSVPDPSSRGNVRDTWRLELVPPAAVSESSDNPLMANDKRVGLTFKLDF
jgi:hypothetical protein